MLEVTDTGYHHFHQCCPIVTSHREKVPMLTINKAKRVSDLLLHETTKSGKGRFLNVMLCRSPLDTLKNRLFCKVLLVQGIRRCRLGVAGAG